MSDAVRAPQALPSTDSVSANDYGPRTGVGAIQPIARSPSRKAKPRSLRLHGTVARDLGIRIVSGILAPGAMLEGEIAASEQFKVSRTAYREAIRILAAKGLVDSRPKIGTQVSERSAGRLLDDPKFKKRVNQLRAHMIRRAMGKMAAGMAEAAATLRSLLKAESEAIRLGASRALLELTVRL